MILNQVVKKEEVTIGNDIVNAMGTKLSELPDLSVLDRTGEVLYAVVDTSKCECYGYSEFRCRPTSTTGGTYTIDRGHITNGAYVVDESFTVPLATYWSDTLNKNGERFWVYRIVNLNGITRIDSNLMPNLSTQSALFTPVVALYGNLPNLTSCSFIFNSSQANLIVLDVKNVKLLTSLGMGPYICKLDNVTAAMPTNIFYLNTKIKQVDMSSWNIDSSTSLAGLFYSANNLESVVIGSHSTSGVTSIRNMFNGTQMLNRIDLSGLDLTSVTSGNTANAFSCGSLMHIDGWTAIPVSYSLSDCSNLTHDSLMVVINSLPTVQTTQTLTLGSILTAKLTADEIAVATAKGWTVA